MQPPNVLPSPCPSPYDHSGTSANASVSDAILIRAIAEARSADAFSILFERHSSSGLALALRLTGNQATAEDVLQEAMLQVWKTASTFRWEGNARAWIHSMVLGISLKKRRREARYRGRSEGERPLAWPARVQWSARHTRLMAVIFERMGKLTQRYRQVLELYYWNGMTQNRISQLLSIPQRTVSREIAEALKLLKRSVLRDDPL